MGMHRWKSRIAAAALVVFIGLATSRGAELPRYRLLSVSTSTKLILVSDIPAKKKLLLDASAAKITIDSKPAEFKALQAYSVLRLAIKQQKTVKGGIELDGTVTEIQVALSEHPK